MVDRRDFDPRMERNEVLAGLLGEPAVIAPKYFYDELGCALYAAICRLPEYYLTRTEAALFHSRRSEIASLIGKGRQMVDLGAGDCGKAREWLTTLSPSRYAAVDFAVAEIEGALSRLAPDFPGLELVGVAADFTRLLDLDGILDRSPALFFYPGSSIGNFAPDEAGVFLAHIHRHFAARPGSSLLIGVDGKKAKAVLDAAYDDALGVTAAFNRNVLRHLNRRFGFDFEPAGYSHVAFYNEAKGRVEMHLQSVRDQVVRIDGHERLFRQGERIHTESSWKYSPAEFEALLAGAGFTTVRRWAADGVAYSVFLAN